jgi:hypothetical protein
MHDIPSHKRGRAILLLAVKKKLCSLRQIARHKEEKNELETLATHTPLNSHRMMSGMGLFVH